MITHNIGFWRKFNCHTFHYMIYATVKTISLLSSAKLIAFANSLDPDQDRQNVDPDLDPNFLSL